MDGTHLDHRHRIFFDFKDFKLARYEMFVFLFLDHLDIVLAIDLRFVHFIGPVLVAALLYRYCQVFHRRAVLYMAQTSLSS